MGGVCELGGEEGALYVALVCFCGGESVGLVEPGMRWGVLSSEGLACAR